MKKFWMGGTAACILLFSCAQPATPDAAKNKIEAPRQKKIKPSATYQDTLVIPPASIVFYEPDSIQLDKIKAANDPSIFSATMHEFEFQIKNARHFLKTYHPHLRILEARNVRYLRFTGPEYTSVIDLDTRNDACGMFLFDGWQPPHPADMMNVESEVPGYFQHYQYPTKPR
jgi:hypothetical protein